MPIEDHSLVNEFPEFKDDIHQLKMDDAHFKKLYDEYHHLTKEVEKMEQRNYPFDHLGRRKTQKTTPAIKRYTARLHQSLQTRG